MSKNGDNVAVGFKLDGKNFPIWSHLMLVTVGSRGRLEHLEGDEKPPRPGDPKYKEWQEADLTVFSWLVQNMKPKLVMQFAQHKTAKAMWKSLVTIFGVLTDPFQIYDLETMTNKANQGNQSLEDYWADLQSLWVNIDERKLCPYTCCDKAIAKYWEETETKRMYQFLGGLNDQYDGICREILKESVGDPSAEAAFGRISQEAARTMIWKPTTEPAAPTGGIGSGFGIRTGDNWTNRPPHRSAPPSQPPYRPNNRSVSRTNPSSTARTVI